MNFGMCGRWRNGRLASICTMAGTEECDFECPHRDEPDDEAFRQHQRDRIKEAKKHDAEQAKPKLTPGVTGTPHQTNSQDTPIGGNDVE